MPNYPKRLIEVDLPIKKISAHARREKSIRHGHISTLHIWWARRPLAACRAVICASLWIDPVDELCPDVFRVKAAELIMAFAKQAATDKELAKSCDGDTWKRWQLLAKPENALDMAKPEHRNILRYWLLDFIADFANWDNSTQPDYLATSRALTQAAHEALGGMPGTRPLVVDPFAGGGAIPLEALRVGADAFASDLNPVAVLLNKVVLEYIPKYGQQLVDEVRKWGQWIKEEAEKELGEFYPKDEDGSTPIAYLWARTIISEAPDDGSGIPVEVPLMRSLWLAKKKSRNRALRWVRDGSGQVQTETVEITYTDGVTRTVRRPLLEIFEPKSAKEVENGTVKRGSGTCPVTGFTTPVASVRQQLKARRGGADDARLFCVVINTNNGKNYRPPNLKDYLAIKDAEKKRRNIESLTNNGLSLITHEKCPPEGALGFRFQKYGIEYWRDLYTKRQLVTLSIIALKINQISKITTVDKNKENISLEIIQVFLSLALGRVNDLSASLCRWLPSLEAIAATNGGQNKMPMVLDFVETNPFGGAGGDWMGQINWIVRVINNLSFSYLNYGNIQRSPAQKLMLPDGVIDAFITDPPYYDAFGYSDLSEFFYIWLRRANSPEILDYRADNVPKKEEAVSIGKILSDERGEKNESTYKKEMESVFSITKLSINSTGIGVIVFANKTTVGWESILQAIINSDWVITGSWPIDTERPNRQRAQNSASLSSSVHIVCRPRTTNQIGDWREILTELPQRIHEWMPRLASEGVVGADAIFACLGPALEIYSRYASVERANGEEVTLREYLEYVWATVSKEALGMIFDNATATDLEEDARLTAMWLWTLSTDGQSETPESSEDLEEEDDDDDDTPSKKKKIPGFTLEYDAARKIAQGLGAYLEKLTSLVEIKGSNARLLPVAERAIYLFGKEGLQEPKPKAKRSKSKQLTLDFGDVINQLTEEQGTQEITVTQVGKTILDRIHQAMLLFAAGRSDALSRFLVEDGIGADQRFWALAQSLSALYPPGTDEKRWIDGILARKKGLGF